jgi:hypothetical protein
MIVLPHIITLSSSNQSPLSTVCNFNSTISHPTSSFTPPPSVLFPTFFLSHLDSGKIVVILNFYLRPIFFFRTLILFKILLSLLHVFLFKLISSHFKKNIMVSVSGRLKRNPSQRRGFSSLFFVYIF